MGMLTNNRDSNTSVVNMTPVETDFKERLLLLSKNGITNPQQAVEFMLDVIKSDRHTISAEFQSLRQDSIDEQMSVIETAVERYKRKQKNVRERKADLIDAMNMLEPAVRTLLKRTQRYVDNVIAIDNMPTLQRITHVFHQLSTQVENYSFCARVCFEGAVAGMTYARAIDTELGGGRTEALIQAFNDCVTQLTNGDSNRRCLIMSEYAANEDLEAFWLEIPEASSRMINSGDWGRFTELAGKSTHTRIAPAPIDVQNAKPGLFSRLKKWLSGFIQRLVFLFTGKPFDERKTQIPASANPAKRSDSPNAESESEEPDYEHIVF